MCTKRFVQGICAATDRHTQKERDKRHREGNSYNKYNPFCPDIRP